MIRWKKLALLVHYYEINRFVTFHNVEVIVFWVVSGQKTGVARVKQSSNVATQTSPGLKGLKRSRKC